MKKFLFAATLIFGFLFVPHKTFAAVVPQCTSSPPPYAAFQIDPTLLSGWDLYDNTKSWLIFSRTGTPNYWQLVYSDDEIVVGNNGTTTNISTYSFGTRVARRTVQLTNFTKSGTDITGTLGANYSDVICILGMNNLTFHPSWQGDSPTNWIIVPPPDPEPEPGGGITDEQIARAIGVTLAFAIAAYFIHLMRYRGSR